VKSAHLTRESGSSSWATPQAFDHVNNSHHKGLEGHQRNRFLRAVRIHPSKHLDRGLHTFPS
jgi:hypothetical protein